MPFSNALAPGKRKRTLWRVLRIILIVLLCAGAYFNLRIIASFTPKLVSASGQVAGRVILVDGGDRQDGNSRILRGNDRKIVENDPNDVSVPGDASKNVGRKPRGEVSQPAPAAQGNAGDLAYARNAVNQVREGKSVGEKVNSVPSTADTGNSVDELAATRPAGKNGELPAVPHGGNVLETNPSARLTEGKGSAGAVSQWLDRGPDRKVVAPARQVRPRVRRQPEQPSPSPIAVAPVPSPEAFPFDVSSLTSFIQAGGHLPVLVVTRTRTDELAATLSSLLSVRGVTREAVFVVQDGTAADTKAVIDSFGIRCHQKTQEPVLPRKARGQADTAAARIALHFRYALEYMFDTVTAVRDGVCCLAVSLLLWSPDRSLTFWSSRHPVLLS
jgi:hypothetical protein